MSGFDDLEPGDPGVTSNGRSRNANRALRRTFEESLRGYLWETVQSRWRPSGSGSLADLAGPSFTDSLRNSPMRPWET